VRGRTIRSAAPSPEPRPRKRSKAPTSGQQRPSLPEIPQRIKNTKPDLQLSVAEAIRLCLTYILATGQGAATLVPGQWGRILATRQWAPISLLYMGAATMSSALITSDRDGQDHHELNDEDEGGLFGDGDEDDGSGYDRLHTTTTSSVLTLFLVLRVSVASTASSPTKSSSLETMKAEKIVLKMGQRVV